MTKSLITQETVNPLVRFFSLIWLNLKRIYYRNRIHRPLLEKISNHYFLVLPGVLNPVVFRSGKYFAEFIAESDISRPQHDSLQPRALDMGTGCGACAVAAAELGYRVTGTDINPEAVRCAMANVLLNDMEEKIDIRQGDLFTPVTGEKFDLIMFNPPFYRGIPKNNFDMAWRSRDVFERFSGELNNYLTPVGRVLILLSTDGDAGDMLHLLNRNHLEIKAVTQRHFGNEIMTVYLARPVDN